MTDVSALAKATLQEISWDRQGTPQTQNPGGQRTEPFAVQFNPQSLRVSYSNQKAAGDQPAGSPIQFVGSGTTRLNMELIFDTTHLEISGPAGDPRDVRELTQQVQALMKPSPRPHGRDRQFIPPGVRFQWGSFLFEGVMDSMDETLDYFSATGVPLRATVALVLSKQDVDFQRLPATAEGPGTSAFEQARSGDSVQQMAARTGNPDWRGVAVANGIENPRRLAPGTLVSLTGANAGIGAAALGANLRAGIGAGFSARLGAGSAGGLGAGFGGSISGGIGGSLGAGLSAGVGLGGSVAADARLAGGISLGASAESSASAGAEFR